MNELVKYENGEVLIPEELTNQIKAFEEHKKEVEYQEKLLKEALLEIMPNLPESTVVVNGIKFIYKKGSTAKTVDSKKLKEEAPEVYEAYLKETYRSPSVSIQVEE